MSRSSGRTNWGVLILWGSASALAGAFLTSTDAEAIPAFARKYDMDCSHCHVMAPKLNKVGYKFHDNFTLKEAVADLSEDMRDRIKSEDPEDIHPAYWPVSIRVAGGYQYNKRDNQATDNGLETITTQTFALTRFEVLAGGLFTPGISYYLSYYPEALNVGLPGQPPVHAHPGATSGTSQVGALGFAWVRFADVFGQFAKPEDHAHDEATAEHAHDADAEQKHEHGQDLIFGSHELHLTLSGHHRLTNSPYLAYRYDPRFSLNTSEGFQLDAPQLGASLDGATPWFGYALSVYNGTTSSADNNRALDVFATVTQEVGDQRVGVFGVRGTAPTSFVTTGGGTTPIAGTGKDNQPFYRFGADADLNFGPFNLMLFGLYGQDDKELFGTSSATQTAKYYSGFVEGDYMIESARTIVLGRYDLIRNLEQGISTNPDNRGDTDALTLAVRRDLVLTSRANLQFQLEANTMRIKATAQGNKDQISNTLFAGLDWSF